MFKNQEIWITNDILQYIININYTKLIKLLIFITILTVILIV